MGRYNRTVNAVAFEMIKTRLTEAPVDSGGTIDIQSRRSRRGSAVADSISASGGDLIPVRFRLPAVVDGCRETDWNRQRTRMIALRPGDPPAARHSGDEADRGGNQPAEPVLGAVVRGAVGAIAPGSAGTTAPGTVAPGAAGSAGTPTISGAP